MITQIKKAIKQGKKRRAKVLILSMLKTNIQFNKTKELLNLYNKLN